MLKQQEKRFINSLLSNNIENTDNYKSISKLKYDTSLNIFKRYLNFSESSYRKTICVSHSCGQFEYSYQRSNLEFITNNWLKFLYNIDLKNIPLNKGSFFSCGMATISTLINILHKHNYKNYLFSNLPYFESTEYLINHFNDTKFLEDKNYNLDFNIDILWLDSCSPEIFKLDYTKIKTKIIVCDTSCFDCSCDYLKNLILFCIENKITLFLNRSHMKLDCFGLEINRLGSLVAINDYENILNECINLKVPLGNNTTLHNIYPWLGENEFFKLTTERIKKTQKINNTIEKTLDNIINKNKYDLVHFDHELYFTIRFKERYKNNFNYLNTDLSLFCQKYKLPINTAASFYLENLGIDNFERKLDNNRQHLRISSSVISEKKAVEIGKKINKFLDLNN